MTHMDPPPMDRWGDYDRDRPFPLFAEVRAAGPVHDVTLADGHRAFLVVGYAAAREALNHPDLSKDMHAALAGGDAVVAEGLPGPDFARHMLSVDPPDHTRLRGLAAKAFTRTRLQALEPRIRQIADDLLDDLADQGPGAGRPGRRVRRPAAVRRPRRAPRHRTDGPDAARGLVRDAPGAVRRSRAPGRSRGRVGQHRRLPDRPGRPQLGVSDRRPGRRPGQLLPRGRAHQAGTAVHVVPARRGRS